MSTMQRMTLVGLYNYENTFGRDLFRNLALPEGYDKTTFVNSLLLEHGEKCVLYTNPDFFVSAIGIWCGKWGLELERIYDALTEEYNPIWNYDRHDEWTETDKPDNLITRTHNNTDTQTNNNTDTTTNNNTDTTTNRYDVVTTQNIDSTSENQISADNSSSYQPDNKNISNAGKTTVANDGTITDAHTGTITDAHTGTITDAHTGTITDSEKGTRSNIDHKAHMWGNIGVTTSSQLAESETLLRAKRNLYDIATRLFANELLIGIY